MSDPNKSKKGPVVTIHGMQVRSLPTETLSRQQDQWAQEVVYWRNETAQTHRTNAHLCGELEKAEATIRNQDVELRRLRARVAELESR